MNQNNIAQLWAWGEAALRAGGASELEIRLVKMGFYQGGFQIMAHYFSMIENGVTPQEINTNVQSIISDCQAHFAQERSARPMVSLIAALMQAGESGTTYQQYPM